MEFLIDLLKKVHPVEGWLLLLIGIGIALLFLCLGIFSYRYRWWTKLKDLFRLIWELVKTMGTVRGIISLVVVWVTVSGAGFFAIGWLIGGGLGTAIMGISSAMLLFWAGPFTPLLPLTVIVAMLFQRYVLRDKNNDEKLKNALQDYREKRAHIKREKEKTKEPRKIVLGLNMKANFSLSTHQDFLVKLTQNENPLSCEVVLFSSTIFLRDLANSKSSVRIASQNMHAKSEGPYTGETSVSQLERDHIQDVLIGHIDIRMMQNETDLTVNDKLKAALASNVRPFVCLGQFGFRLPNEKQLLRRQIRNIYSDVSAIEAMKSLVVFQPHGVLLDQELKQYIKIIRKYLRELFGRRAAERIGVLFSGKLVGQPIGEMLSKRIVDGYIANDLHLIEDVMNSLEANEELTIGK